MHPNPAFRKPERQQNIDFARERAFGTLAVNAENGPLLSHIPFQLSVDGKYLEAHLVRSNPILRLLEQTRPAVLSVLGPDGYVSPDWYGVENQVPTWNYIAVHLRGTLQRLPDSELHPILERLSAAMESRLLPKKPWTIDKMDQDIYAKMQRQIVPVMMDVADVQGTWKLSQNKTTPARHGAAKGARDAGLGSQTAAIAVMMEEAGDS